MFQGYSDMLKMIVKGHFNIQYSSDISFINLHCKLTLQISASSSYAALAAVKAADLPEAGEDMGYLNQEDAGEDARATSDYNFYPA